MTTQEAYKLALALRNTGMGMNQISTELARKGYVSFKTGRKLSKGGVSLMIIKARNGHIPTVTRKMKPGRSMAHLYAPRVKRNTVAATTTVPVQPLFTGFNIAQRSAMERLEAQSQSFRATAEAIDTLLAAIR